MHTITKNAIFTNVALTDEGDVWWEGMTATAPEHLVNWLGHDWTPQSTEKASHPNARFTVAAAQCPVIDPAWESPAGVPISAILFGGRRASTMPLVCEAFNWQHGTFLGASISSEMTAAAEGTLGKLRHDPFAMLPFCGYHMGDYFAHWLKVGKRQNAAKLPRIYAVNWFRKGQDGKFLWPGFGENSRVLKWIFERTEGADTANETPIGYLPTKGALDTDGLQLAPQALEQLFEVDAAQWHKEADEIRGYLAKFGTKLPPEFDQEIDALHERLEKFDSAIH